jgi:hypothetical protein
MRVPDPPASLPEPGRRDLTVEITRIDARGRSGRRATVAAVVVAGALGVAILSGVLFPAAPAPTRPSPSGLAAAPTVSAGPARPSEAPAATPEPAPVMPAIAQASVSGLADRLRSGALDGSIVLVTGTLGVVRTACADGAGVCPSLSIAGLDVPVVVSPELLPWDRDPAAGATLVMAAGAGTLTFLGAIPPGVSQPAAITDLAANRARPLALNDLYPVNGVLLPDPGPCNLFDGTLPEDPPPCEVTPILLDADPVTSPWDFTAKSVTVSLGSGTFDPGGAIRIEGTFLVRRVYHAACDPARLPAAAGCASQLVVRPQVVAEVTPTTAIAVSVPADSR